MKPRTLRLKLKLGIASTVTALSLSPVRHSDARLEAQNNQNITAFAETRHPSSLQQNGEFEPSLESARIISSINDRLGISIMLPNTWDLSRSRLTLQNPPEHVLATISDALRTTEPLVDLYSRTYGKDQRTLWPNKISIYCLKGLEGSPGGSFRDDSIALIVPCANILEDAAYADKDGVRRHDTKRDKLEHAVIHELIHRFTEQGVTSYLAYRALFWIQNRDGTWKIRDRRNLTGYPDDGVPWEHYADSLASLAEPPNSPNKTLGQFGRGSLSASLLIHAHGQPELRGWIEAGGQEILPHGTMPQIAIPFVVR